MTDQRSDAPMMIIDECVEMDTDKVMAEVENEHFQRSKRAAMRSMSKSLLLASIVAAGCGVLTSGEVYKRHDRHSQSPEHAAELMRKAEEKRKRKAKK